MSDAQPLAALLDSRTLAVIGASSRPGSAGERVIHHLAAARFRGETVLVSRREDEVAGQRTYKSLADYEGAIDHALLLVPAVALEGTIRECVDKHVGAASIFAAGFAESGVEGQRQQAELSRLAAEGGVRLLGPNCLGVMNARIGLMATASSALETLDVRPGPVSVVSQSGAVGMHFVALLNEADLGLGYYVSTGNEVDVTVGEVLGHIAGDPDTEVVIMYLEGIRDPVEFCAVLQRLHDGGKSVIAIKVGRTSRSSEAVASHTASLAGNDAVYDAVLRRFGVVRVDSLSQAVEVAQLIVIGVTRRRRPDRVAVVSISGGMGALMAETLESRGYDLPVPSAAAQASMREAVPFCAPNNPIDVTGQVTAQPELLREFMRVATLDDQWDALAVLLSYTVRVPRVYDVYRDALLAQAEESDVVVAVDGLLDDGQLRELRRHGIVVGRDSSDLAHRFDLLRVAHDARHAAGGFEPTPPGIPADTTMPDGLAMSRMADAGVPMAEWLRVPTAGETAAVVEKLGGSVALKLLVPDVLHKANAGHVRIGIGADNAVEVAAELLAAASPGAELIAQAMAASGGAEVILGARRDEVFGLIYLLGRGGLTAEATADTAVLLPPVSRADFDAALAGLRTPVRTRSGDAIDEDALWQAFSGLVRLVSSDLTVIDAELNPVLVGPPGSGAVAVDAVIRGQLAILEPKRIDGTPTQAQTRETT